MNANCQVCGDANAYVAGELPLREQTDFEAHLTVCDECRDAVAATRRVIRRLHALPKLETTRDLSMPVLAQLREAPRTRWHWPQVAAIAAVLMLLAGGIVVTRFKKSEPPAK